MQRLQDREQGKAVAAIGGDLTKPFGNAYTGNPKGDVTLVDFYDYNCGYCRASLPLLKQLTQADPKLRIVYRELPILAPSSKAAARASCSPHRRASSPPSMTRSMPVARSATRPSPPPRQGGRRHEQDGRLPAPGDAEIARNLEAAGRLGLTARQLDRRQPHPVGRVAARTIAKGRRRSAKPLIRRRSSNGGLPYDRPDPVRRGRDQDL